MTSYTENLTWKATHPAVYNGQSLVESVGRYDVVMCFCNITGTIILQHTQDGQ